LGLGDKQKWQLFDLERDPCGLVDVAALHADVVERLRPKLDALRASWKADDGLDAIGGGQADNMRALRALGYVDARPPPRE
jgi:hypothetical protein